MSPHRPVRMWNAAVKGLREGPAPWIGEGNSCMTTGLPVSSPAREVHMRLMESWLVKTP